MEVKYKEALDKLGAVVKYANQNDTNNITTRNLVAKAVNQLLSEMQLYGPIPVDFSIEINYTNNSLNIFFSKEWK